MNEAQMQARIMALEERLASLEAELAFKAGAADLAPPSLESHTLGRARWLPF